MEISWYLRFKSFERIRAFIQKNSRDQVEELKHVFPRRVFDFHDRGGFLEVRIDTEGTP